MCTSPGLLYFGFSRLRTCGTPPGRHIARWPDLANGPENPSATSADGAGGRGRLLEGLSPASRWSPRTHKPGITLVPANA